MKIINLVRSSVLLLPLVSAEASRLNASSVTPPEKNSVSLTREVYTAGQSISSSNLRDYNQSTLVAYGEGILSNYKTDPSTINCPKRNYTKEELQEEIKNRWFGYRWYRDAKFHVSNADQIRHAYNHCNMSLEDYRSLFVRYEHDKNETFLGKVCRAYIPPDPKGKPMYVLLLGHTQKLADSPDDTGVVAIYERLVRERKGIVLMFITGSILDEVDNALALKCRYTEHEVLFAHMERNIKDFIVQYRPSKLGFLGYSWGGGAITKLSKDQWWRSNVPVESTVSMDGVNLGVGNLATACRERPYFDAPHHQIYQREGGVHPFRIQGNSLKKITYLRRIPIGWEIDWRKGDVNWRVPNTVHNSIDDLPDVRRWVYNYLLK